MNTQELRVAVNLAYKTTITAQVNARLAIIKAMETPGNEEQLAFINNIDDGLERINHVYQAMLENLDLYEASQQVDHLERCLALGGGPHAA